MGSSRTPRRAPQPLRRQPLPVAQQAPAFVLPAVPTDWFPGLSQRWMSAPLLADTLDPERNSFGVLRLMMALAVLISHAVFLWTGTFSAEPLVALTGYSLGQYGVQGFFILSGILVAQSLVQRGDIRDYGRARALRIFPALIVCVLATTLVLGPVVSFLGPFEYFTSFGVVRYIASTLSLSTGSAQLPGVFPVNPAASVVNQSLWTLKYEVACYILLAGMSALIWQVKAQRFAAGCLLAAWAAMILLVRPTLAHDGFFFSTLAYFSLFFGTGVAAYLFRAHIRLSWLPLPVLLAFFAVSLETDMAEITSALLLGATLLWLSTFTFGSLRAFTSVNDYSYGAYIYSFPVSQTILAVWPGINLVSLIALTLAATLMLAFFSWELIERPALGLVRRMRDDETLAADHTAGIVLDMPLPEIAAAAVVDGSSDRTVEDAALAERQPVPVRRRTAGRVPLTRDGLARMGEASRVAGEQAVPVIDKSRLRARMAKISEDANRLSVH